MPQISSWAMFLWPVYVALGCINALGSRECQRPKAWPISWAATWTRSFSHTPVQRQHAIQSKKNRWRISLSENISPYIMFLLCDFWVQTFKIQSELVMNTLKHCFMNIYESFVSNRWFRACIKLPKSHDFSKQSFIISYCFKSYFQNV